MPNPESAEKVFPVKSIVADIHYGGYNFITDAGFHYDLKNDRILVASSLDDDAFIHLAQNKPELLNAEAQPFDFDGSKMKAVGLLDHPVEIVYGYMQLRRHVEVFEEIETKKQRFFLRLSQADLAMLNTQEALIEKDNTDQAQANIERIKQQVLNQKELEPLRPLADSPIELDSVVEDLKRKPFVPLTDEETEGMKAILKKETVLTDEEIAQKVEDLKKIIPVKKPVRAGYVVIPELPEEQQESFKKWLIGQTRPVIKEEGENASNCAYEWDYARWLKAWQKGEIAEIED